MPFSTIATPEAKPVANYKMATRMEGGRLLYISGQVAWDAAGNIVGKGDVRAQAKQVFENLRGVLRAAGATPASVVKETTWVQSIDSWHQHGRAVRRGVYKTDFPASTLVEIPGLARPEFLVEIEVIAAVA